MTQVAATAHAASSGPAFLANVGSFLVVLGCAFAIAGFLQFVVSAIGELAKTAGVAKPNLADPLDGLAKLVEALAKLPHFALATFVGIILIAIGQRLLLGGELLSY